MYETQEVVKVLEFPQCVSQLLLTQAEKIDTKNGRFEDSAKKFLIETIKNGFSGMVRPDEDRNGWFPVSIYVNGETKRFDFNKFPYQEENGPKIAFFATVGASITENRNIQPARGRTYKKEGMRPVENSIRTQTLSLNIKVFSITGGVGVQIEQVPGVSSQITINSLGEIISPRTSGDIDISPEDFAKTIQTLETAQVKVRRIQKQ